MRWPPVGAAFPMRVLDAFAPNEWPNTPRSRGETNGAAGHVQIALATVGSQMLA